MADTSIGGLGFLRHYGPVVELVDTAVLKTAALVGLRVRSPPGLLNANSLEEKMARKTQSMKQLEELRDQLDRQIEELKNKREGVDLSIQTLARGGVEREVAEKPTRTRAPRSNVKTAVLDLLTQVKGNGLNAAMVVDMAREQRGVRLERGSVSSLLSRLKHEGIVVYDKKFYRLTEHAPVEPEPRGNPSASVHPLRASGDTPRG